MKYVVIAFCILIILLAVYILIKTLRSSFKGNCCGGCAGCKLKGNCSLENKIEINKEAKKNNNCQT